jgi:hypothetical protein
MITSAISAAVFHVLKRPASKIHKNQESKKVQKTNKGKKRSADHKKTDKQKNPHQKVLSLLIL